MGRLGVLVAIALVVLPAVARANGRYPEAGQLVIDPVIPGHLVARTTYGVIQSTDSGATWTWVCEGAVGYTGAVDPAIAVTSGATLAAIPGGVSRTTDGGCAWSIAPGPLAGAFVIDLAIDRASPRHVVALTLPQSTAPGTQATFAESTDDGATWNVPGALLPEDFRPVTVDVAPSRPQRVYASGNGAYPRAGVFVRSDDGGKTWEQLSFDMRGGRVPFIAAIDPTNPDIIWLRMKADDGDRLWVSTARGIAWREVFVASGPLLGFALSPDGANVAVGVPGNGVWVASTSALFGDAGGADAFVFARALDVRCLTWASAGLYACAYEPAAGFSIGLSTDQGKSFAPLYRAPDLVPQACPAQTSAGEKCGAVWPGVQASLGQESDGGVGGLTVPADASTDNGGSRASASGHACSCSFGDRRPASCAAWFGALACAMLALRRRTRCRQCAACD